MDIVNAFEQQNPDIKVDVVGIPWTDTQQQLTVRTAGGNAPCVALLSEGWVPTFAAMGAIEPLDTLIPQSTWDKMQWAKPALIDLVSVGGKPYSLTWGMYTFPLIYNKVVMQKAGLDPNSPPVTWDDFEKDILKVAQSGNTGWGRDFTQGGNGGLSFVPWLWAYGGDMYDAKGNVTFDSPAGVAALTAMANLYKANKNSFDFGIDQYSDRDIFAKDKQAFLLEAAWIRPILESSSGLGQADDSHWGVAQWPESKVTGKPITEVGSMSWAIFKQCKYKDAAAKFANFVVSDAKMQEAWSQAFGSIPPFKEYLDSFPMFKDPYYAPFAQALSTGKGLPGGPMQDVINTDISVAMQQAFTGADPGTALRNAANLARLTLGQTPK